MERSSGRRKKILIVLGVIAWLLMLGGISYYLCLPDLDEMSRNLRAIREDPNLTPEERFEKSREIYSKLTLAEGKEVFQNDIKKFHHERNAEMQKFLKMSLEEQTAYIRKQDEERKQFRRQGGFALGGGTGGKPGSGPGGGPVAFKPGGGQFVVGAKVGGGRAVQFVGPPGAGPGKGPINAGQIQKNMLDNFSPETRAGMSYQRGLSR